MGDGRVLSTLCYRGTHIKVCKLLIDNFIRNKKKKI